MVEDENGLQSTVEDAQLVVIDVRQVGHVS